MVYGSFEVYSLHGHLEYMESVVQPTDYVDGFFIIQNLNKYIKWYTFE